MARPTVPSRSQTSASTVGLPRESSTCRPRISEILLMDCLSNFDSATSPTPLTKLRRFPVRYPTPVYLLAMWGEVRNYKRLPRVPRQEPRRLNDLHWVSALNSSSGSSCNSIHPSTGSASTGSLFCQILKRNRSFVAAGLELSDEARGSA